MFGHDFLKNFFNLSGSLYSRMKRVSILLIAVCCLEPLLRVSTSAARTFMSPLELLSQMTTCVLPPRTHTQLTRSGRAKRFPGASTIRSTLRLGYRWPSPRYTSVGTSWFSSSKGGRCVSDRGLYPADRASDLGQFFDSGKPWFRDVVLKHKRFLRRLMCEIKEQGALPSVAGRVAYVTGQFLRGLGDFPSAQG